MRVAALIVVFLAACGGYGGGSGNEGIPDAGADVVTIGWSLAAQGTPVTTTIDAGVPVRWHSTDGQAHTVTPNTTPPPNAVDVSGGAVSATQTILAPGTYSYHCSIHPGMRGTLVVQ